MRSIYTPFAAALVTVGAVAWAQQAPSTDKPDPTAATTTGTTTSQSEMNRGMPGVNVDVGRNASGAVDVDVDRNTNARNLGSEGSTTSNSTDGSLAARTDRN